MTITLKQVRSYLYLIAGTAGDPGFNSAIGASPVDMVICGDGPAAKVGALLRSIADPAASKLILGYINVGEAYAYANPALFAGALPSWFGKPNRSYEGIYTVQYWTPAWLTEITTKIATLARAGYDGVFLDVLSADLEWSAGNLMGNPVRPTAVADLVSLVGKIRAYVDGLNLGRPFYLIGNQPTTLAIHSPATLKLLDVAFNEIIYWGADMGASGSVATAQGPAATTFVNNILAPAYDSAGIRVFGGDYPPLSNLAEVQRSFEFYTARGWTPSVQAILPTVAILSTGPFMFMATPDAPVAVGAPNAFSFVSGGLVPSATLIGGGKGNVIIGGPGHNVIVGGAGDDTIYPHPASAAQKNLLQLQFIGDVVGAAALPQVTVKINGKIAAGPVVISALWANGAATQEVGVDVAGFGPIKSIEIDAVGLKWTSAAHYNDLFLTSAALGGRPIALSSATLVAGVQLRGKSILFSAGGVATLPAPAPIPVPDTSSIIDGGAGSNTVVYRGKRADYTLTSNPDGSFTVTGLKTAEGPDTLRNVQAVRFADQTISPLPAPGPAKAARGFRRVPERDFGSLLEGDVAWQVGEAAVLSPRPKDRGSTFS